MRNVLEAAFLTIGLFAACGGDVVVDGEPGSSQGQGGGGGTGASSTGSGASSTSTSTSSTTPTTTASGPQPQTATGPACDCFGACMKTSGCFGEEIPCDEFCNGVPTE